MDDLVRYDEINFIFEVINLKKIKSNIVLIILGCLSIATSLIIGYLNQFSDGQGMSFLLIGVALLAVGLVFTPKIWEKLGYVIDMIVMFFSKP